MTFTYNGIGYKNHEFNTENRQNNENNQEPIKRKDTTESQKQT